MAKYLAHLSFTSLVLLRRSSSPRSPPTHVISYRTMSGYDCYWMGRTAWTDVIRNARTMARLIWYHVPPRLTLPGADFAKFVEYTPEVLREVFGVYPTAVAGRASSGGCFAAGTACEPDPGLLPSTTAPPLARHYARTPLAVAAAHGGLNVALSAPFPRLTGPPAPLISSGPMQYIFTLIGPSFTVVPIALRASLCIAAPPRTISSICAADAALVAPVTPAARSLLHPRVRALHHAPRFDRAPASAPCPGASPRPRTSLLASLCPTLTLVPTLRPHPTLRTARLASPKRPPPPPLLLPRFTPGTSPFTLHACRASPARRASLRPSKRAPAARLHPAPRFAPSARASPLAHAPPSPASRFAPASPRTPRFAPAPRLSSAPRFASPRTPAPRPSARVLPQRPRVAPAPSPPPRLLPRPRFAPTPRFAPAYAPALSPHPVLRLAPRT
ncbi:hypothetical protein B0H14DRAFT_3705532, partial [Mycena olivaceomarginata]